MRLIITLLMIALLAGTYSTAQNLSLKKTDQLFKNQAYTEAIVNYKNLETSEEVLQKLGDSYYYTNDFENAANTYTKLKDNFSSSLDKDRMYRYAHSLLGIKDYQAADVYLKTYYGKDWNTEEFLFELERTTPHVFEVVPIINKGSKSDFGLSFIDGKNVAFASSRNMERPVFSWNGIPYLDIYEGQLNDTALSKVTPFSEEINTDLHESNAVFTNNGTVMYFNRNTEKRVKIDGDRVSNIQLYRAEKVDNKWTNVALLPFNNELYSVEHPSISKDGKTLYFSSNRSGGYGEFDIYKIAINEDGSYGEPINLGNSINTAYRDQFPYISDINTLYYATNGKQGLGGLDIHRANLVNGEFDTPINLGSSINSSKDDYAFVIDEATNESYFSSNRDGLDQLYTGKREENILTKYQVVGVVQDSISRKTLPGSLVSLLDERGVVIDDMITGNDASYLFKIEPNKKYTVRATRKLYIPENVDFSTDKNGKVSHDIFLTLLSYQDAEETINADRKGEVQVELEQIYFDFDQAIIKPKAAATLDDLVAIMNKYPEMHVEVSAHTDVRGPSEYNLTLSNQRAASTMKYLISQGIDENRLRSIGYGEMQPLNECVKEGICIDEEYEINRRCEFKVMQ
ncbi:OmpA family protein [Nonlabens sp.]|uniref:OmpA family protein n=1 Tax=Nonlabens sp. TaxID=1888209 RepID=UPI001BCC995C|nr:OmpA family protein [Nonlabens sp.]